MTAILDQPYRDNGNRKGRIDKIGNGGFNRNNNTRPHIPRPFATNRFGIILGVTILMMAFMKLFSRLGDHMASSSYQTAIINEHERIHANANNGTSSLLMAKSLPADTILPPITVTAPVAAPPLDGSYLIPRTMWFTYKTDILETKTPAVFYENIHEIINAYRHVWNDPTSRVEFLNDEGCVSIITEVEPRLVKPFEDESSGRLKADICRLATLYRHGGYYFDIDTKMVRPLILPPTVSLSIVIQPKRGDVFQGFLASSPDNVVLRRALDTMVKSYEGSFEIKKNKAAESLKYAFDNRVESEGGEVLVLEEVDLTDRSLYPDLARQYGLGCCCNFAVHDPASSIVHFYSRIVGSGPRCASAEIPPMMWFTYKTNILETKEPAIYYENVRNTVVAYRDVMDKSKVRMKFLDDDKCIDIIREVEPKLVKYFEEERFGHFKADICRIAVLYLHGGYYFDIDLKVIKPLVLPPDISFATVVQPVRKDFFQAFMASAPQHPVLEKTIQTILAAYEGKFEVIKTLGTETLKYAYQTIPEYALGNVLLLEEINLAQDPSSFPELPRQEGLGCCCSYAVHDPNTRTPYFYSRIVGSSSRCAFVDIPRVIYFAYEYDILDAKEPGESYANAQNTIARYREAWKEDARVEVLHGSRCVEVIADVTPKLSPFYENEGDAAYRQDMCKVAMLFKYGGYYFDLDLKVEAPLILPQDVSFSTVRDSENIPPTAFPRYMASAPNHALLEKTLQTMLAVYLKKFRIEKSLGAETLQYAYDNIAQSDWGKVEMLEEIDLVEITTYPEFPRQDGYGCCCNRVMHNPRSNLPHFYSHAVGTGEACTRQSETHLEVGMVPHVLWFVHPYNIVAVQKPRSLYENVQNTISTYQEALGRQGSSPPPAHFLKYDKCAEIISKVEPKLVPFFQQESNDKFKEDICKFAVLFHRGGYVFSVDLKVTTAPIILPPTVSFSAIVDGKKDFFLGFMATSNEHPTIKRTVQTILDFYLNKFKLKRGDLGGEALKYAYSYETVTNLNRGEVLMLQRVDLLSKAMYPNFPRQEGIGCCCNQVVRHPDNQSIHFYAHVVGSGSLCTEKQIPRTIWFSHKVNLFETKSPKALYENALNTVTSYGNAWGYTQRMPVKFLNESNCQVMVYDTNPDLAQMYDESGANFKSDICILAALYLNGGYYINTDSVVVSPLILPPTTSFSAISRPALDDAFPTFLASSVKHPLLSKALDTIIAFYRGKFTVDKALGAETLKHAYETVPELHWGEVTMLEEIDLVDPKIYPSLMREPNGQGCCCDLIVHDPKAQQVYFKSHLPGASHLCSPPVVGIPHILWFTYKNNVLQTKSPGVFYNNMMNTVQKYTDYWKTNHPDQPTRVEFLDDEACVRIIEETEPKLVPYFQAERHGYFKADICRIAALYLHGGYYFDIDLRVIVPFTPPSEVSFVTVLQPERGDFFQAFLGSTPRSEILKKAIQNMLMAFEGTFEVVRTIGPETLRSAYDTVPQPLRGETHLMKEINLADLPNSYPSVKRQDGFGCCCNHAVIDEQTKQLYFFSRIVGRSPRCSFKIIPQIIWYAHERNLLLEENDHDILSRNMRHTVDTYREAWGNPDARVEYLDNDRCHDFVRQAAPKLVVFFVEEPLWSSRLDMCRIAVLHMQGGYVFDVEMEVVEPLVLPPSMTFAGVSQPTRNDFFQGFLASSPNHPVLWKALQSMVAVYQGRQKFNKIIAAEVLYHAYNYIKEPQRGESLMLEEIHLEDDKDYPNVKRQDGQGCCCNFVIHDPIERQVYFYARIVGSSPRCGSLGNVVPPLKAQKQLPAPKIPTRGPILIGEKQVPTPKEGPKATAAVKKQAPKAPAAVKKQAPNAVKVVPKNPKTLRLRK